MFYTKTKQILDCRFTMSLQKDTSKSGISFKSDPQNHVKGSKGQKGSLLRQNGTGNSSKEAEYNAKTNQHFWRLWGYVCCNCGSWEWLWHTWPLKHHMKTFKWHTIVQNKTCTRKILTRNRQVVQETPRHNVPCKGLTKTYHRSGKTAAVFTILS